jgi:DNA invertase Pin-like site-specific DNA recombinase
MQPASRPSLSVAPLPVAIYTRVSTLNQVGGRFDSCESQAAICRDFIRKRADQGWVEVACYTDAAYSGGSMNRPGIRALKRQIEEGEIKVVVIFKLERMLRSTDEWGPLRNFLQQHGCLLVSTTEDISEETPSGRLKNNLLVSVAEYERLNTAEKVRAKLLEITKRGIWLCGPVPYGFEYDKVAKLLQPHPTEAALVKRIFEQAASLVSLTDLANTLNAEGLRTKERIWKRRQSGIIQNTGSRAFRSDQLRKMILNPIYSGRIRLHGKEYPGIHQPLVSRELWERANAAVLASVQPARCHLQARNKNCHLLKGLAHCAHCGMAMVPSACGKRDTTGRLYRYYSCNRALKDGSRTACPVKSVPAAILESSIIQFVGSLGRHPEVLDHAMASTGRVGPAERSNLLARRREVEATLGALEERIQNCLEVIAAGGSDGLTEELRGKVATLREEKNRHLVEQEKVRQELKRCDQPAIERDRILSALGRFEKFFSKLEQEEQKDLIALCLGRVEIRDRPPPGGQSAGLQTLELHLTVPLATLVSGMEDRVVVSRKTAEPPISSRPVTVSMRLSIRTQARPAVARITKPFAEEVSQLPRPGDVVSLPQREASSPVNPLTRALAWKQMLLRDPELTRPKLAERLGVTEATFSYYMKLLDLAPEIQDFMLALNKAEELDKFSLRKMKSLAALSPEAQITEFQQMSPGFQRLRAAG